MPDGSTATKHFMLCNCPQCTGSGEDWRPADASDGTEVYIPPGNTKPVWTTSQIVQQLTRSHTAWGPTGQAVVVTYSFYTSTSQFPAGYGSGELPGFSAFSAAQQQAAVVALQSWADCANITFQYVADPTQAKIAFANTTSGPGQAWGYYPDSYWQEGGDIWINPNQSSNFQLAPGGYGLLTLLHEIGHAIGLSHPGDYDASQGPVTYSGGAVYLQDTRQYSDMSYFSASNSGASHSAYGATVLLHDIAAAQYLYGVNTTTRTGNTTYGFNSNAGVDALDFTKNTRPVVAIWDAGGYNTLDASGYAVTQTINLNDGQFSSIGGLTFNVAIANGVSMHAAVGGTAVDTLVGNTLDNLLKGGTGNDTYRFGAVWGHDTVEDQGNLNTLSFTDGIGRASLSFAASGNDLLIGRAGANDTILVTNYFINPAAFQFVDAGGGFTPTIGGTPPAPTNRAPTVSGGATVARTLTEDAAATALGIGAPTDPDGDTLSVQITGLPTGGIVRSGGQAVSNGQVLTVAQLTALTFQPSLNFNGTAGAFGYTVSDGKGGSATQSVAISVTSVNDAPVTTALALSVKLAYGRSVAASQLFTASDVDGTITTYQLRDPSGVGSFKLNGATLRTTNGWATVSASQLAGVTYVAGSRAGSETIQVKAYDGAIWGNTISIAMSVQRTVSGGVAITRASAPAGPGSIVDEQPLAWHEVAGLKTHGAAAWLGDGERDRRQNSAHLAGQS